FDVAAQRALGALPYPTHGAIGPRAAVVHCQYYDPPHGLGLLRRGEDVPFLRLGINEVVYCACCSRDGAKVAWATTDGTVYVADVAEVRQRLSATGVGW